ncbi:MAG: polysaccharide biosynthesis C-terminal domain-containing protein [Jatrophihabitans sp.]
MISLVGAQAILASTFAVLSARLLGPSSRGVIVIAASTASLLAMAGSMGVPTGGRMLIARGDATYSLSDHISVTRIMCASQIVVCALVGWPVLLLSHAWRGQLVGLLFVVYGAGVAVVYMVREGAYGAGATRIAAGADAAMNALLVLGVLCLAATHNVTLTTVLSAMTLCVWAEAAFLITSTHKNRGAQRSLGLRRLMTIVQVSFPALVSTMCQGFAFRADRILLGAFSTAGSVGLYGAAVAVSEIACLIAQGASQIAFRLAAHGDYARLSRLRIYVMVSSIGACAGLGVSAGPIVRILLGRQYESAIPMVWVLLAASVPLALFTFQVASLAGAGDLNGAALSSILGAALLAVGCLAFIPLWGGVGAGIASALAYSGMAAASTMRLRRRTQADPLMHASLAAGDSST